LAQGSIFLGHVNDSKHLLSEKNSKIIDRALDAVGLTVFHQKKRKRRQAYVELGAIQIEAKFLKLVARTYITRGFVNNPVYNPKA
jgi:chorismate-pyruvate lyase